MYTDAEPIGAQEPRTAPTESRATASADLGLLDELTFGLSEVQAALGRLDSGTYGFCEHCGEQIDDTTLQSSPTVRLCTAHLAFGPQMSQTIDAPAG